MKDERDVAPPPAEAWHRRYWDRNSQGWSGWGCLAAIMIGFLLVILVIALVAVTYSGYNYL